MSKFANLIIGFSVFICSNLVTAEGRFTPLADTGENPGELTASIYLPSGQQTAAKLWVLLHGCTQKGEDFAQIGGFTQVADEYGIALLLPQQPLSNHPQQCFNWFSPADNQRDSGETLSLKNQILTAKSRLHSNQIYIVGLSAGGAMASGMMAIYPELFDAGAVIAGIPYPCAEDLIQAIACMKSGSNLTPTELAGKLSKHGAWPSLTVITGTDDKVVNPDNARQLALQWVQLNQLEQTPQQSRQENASFSRWAGSNQRPQVTLIQLDGLGHGLPIASDSSTDKPYYLPGFNTAQYLANAWITQQVKD